MLRRPRALVSTFALLSSLACLTVAYPREARAQSAMSPGPDAVFLKDNNVIRGTLTEIVSGDHVTMQLSTGQTARILWNFVSRIEHNGQPVDTSRPVAVPAPAPASASGLSGPPAPAGNVTVHIEGGDVTLEQMRGGGWAGVCSTPCDLSLPIGASYRIVGDGVRSSRGFLLGGSNGDRVHLDVSTGSSGGFVGGIVLISVGSPFVIIGGFTLLVVALVNAADTGASNTDTGGAERAGWIMFGGGVASLITGVILVTGNSSTKVTQSLLPAAGAPPPKADGPRRLPTFREDNVAAAIPKAATAPIFSWSF